MRSMVCSMLRNHGFRRAKRKAVFFRHTLGLGGVWVWLLPNNGARLVVQDLQEVSTYKRVKDLRRRIIALEEIERLESVRWSNRLAQLNDDVRRSAKRVCLEAMP